MKFKLGRPTLYHPNSRDPYGSVTTQQWGDVTNRQLTAVRNVDESEKAKSCSDRGRPWNHYKSGTFLRTTTRGATSIRKRLWGKGNQQR